MSPWWFCREPGKGRVVQEVARDVCHSAQNWRRHVQQGVFGVRKGRRGKETVRREACQADHAPGETATRDFLSTEDRVRRYTYMYLHMTYIFWFFVWCFDGWESQPNRRLARHCSLAGYTFLCLNHNNYGRYLITN